MATASEVVNQAFARLAERPGYSHRVHQTQLALLLSDLIEQGSTGAFEAPTGLGKSLAALIPALANAAINGKRVVIATYTNILAEQYWRQDWPLCQALFAEMGIEVDASFLIGRQRYACLAAMDEAALELIAPFRGIATLGIESEFRQIPGRNARDLSRKWMAISAPPVCPARLCPRYNECFYYNARKRAATGKVVITNHSVVLTDALMSTTADSEGMLGKYDYLILDEAHDFAQAALNGLEFELSPTSLRAIGGIVGRLESIFIPLVERHGSPQAWTSLIREYRGLLERSEGNLITMGTTSEPSILAVSPAEVADHPQVKMRKAPDLQDRAFAFTNTLREATAVFLDRIQTQIADWKAAFPEETRPLAETARNYLSYVSSFGANCEAMPHPRGVGVSYVGRNGIEPMLRTDTVGLAEPLRELIWDKVPTSCLSATLAIDGDFEYMRRTLGIEPAFEEVLPSPFDFSTQAAVYVPKQGRIMDPTQARKEGNEDAYHQVLADELSDIIRTVGGRCLVLFHSRKEMEGTRPYIQVPDHLPILMQTRTGFASVGDQFRREIRSSLFALRSFWTGFDAPGETLSCVVLVRVPFEVPTDPPQIARLAWLQSIGLDAFAYHTLPQAKMMMRQGAGRLIRRTGDRGVIALLDPRLRSKRYGEEILDNLPKDMRTFDDIRDAAGWVGLEDEWA
ncbi:MAG: ATP-dependent DNA helicase [Fimbriimonas sp.]